MISIIYFFSGLFLANGIPHFVNGISGQHFLSPTLHKRFFKKVPSPLFNVIWGLLSFTLSAFLLSLTPRLIISWNLNCIMFVAGFCFASVGLSVYFKRRREKEM